MNTIPEMTEPMSAHWPQPRHIREAEMDATHVLLSAEEVRGLLEYSSSYPSGVYPGKCFKRVEPEGAFLVWFGPVADGKCRVEYRKILEV